MTGYKAEEWHFRYVGRENAEKIYANQMPLEKIVRIPARFPPITSVKI